MRDKLLHFAAGAIIAAPITWIGYPINAVIVAGLAGITKEYIDRATGNGTPELADFIATVMGAAVVAALMAN